MNSEYAFHEMPPRREGSMSVRPGSIARTAFVDQGVVGKREIRDRLLSAGVEGSESGRFANYLTHELNKWTAVLRQAGIRPQ